VVDRIAPGARPAARQRDQLPLPKRLRRVLQQRCRAVQRPQRVAAPTDGAVGEPPQAQVICVAAQRLGVRTAAVRHGRAAQVIAEPLAGVALDQAGGVGPAVEAADVLHRRADCARLHGCGHFVAPGTEARRVLVQQRAAAGESQQPVAAGTDGALGNATRTQGRQVRPNRFPRGHASTPAPATAAVRASAKQADHSPCTHSQAADDGSSTARSAAASRSSLLPARR